MTLNWQQPERNKFEQLLQKGVRTLQRGVSWGTTATSQTQMGWCKRPSKKDALDGTEVMNNFGRRAGHLDDSLCLVMPDGHWLWLRSQVVIPFWRIKPRSGLTVSADDHHREEILQIVCCQWIPDANKSVIRVGTWHLKHAGFLRWPSQGRKWCCCWLSLENTVIHEDKSLFGTLRRKSFKCVTLVSLRPV